MTNSQTVNAYLKGEKAQGNNSLGSISFKGTSLYSYSTQIAKVDRENKVIVVTLKKYSVTTSKQSSLIINAALFQGYEIKRELI